jgi:hypothetical protein
MSALPSSAPSQSTKSSWQCCRCLCSNTNKKHCSLCLSYRDRVTPLITLQAKENAMDIVDCHRHSHSHSHGSYDDKNENTYPNFTAKEKKRKTATCGTNDIWGLTQNRLERYCTDVLLARLTKVRHLTCERVRPLSQLSDDGCAISRHVILLKLFLKLILKLLLNMCLG